MKKKQTNKNAQSNILDLMKSQIDFLKCFNSIEIQFLIDNYDTIVFTRGTTLVKQKQVIDYVGVILNGGAVAEKSKIKYKKNSVLGNIVSLGLEGQRHPQTITAESDGILFAVRIQTILGVSKSQVENTIKSKIINFLSHQTLCELKRQKHFKSILTAQFQIVQQKISQKFYQTNKILSSLLEVLPDPKQKLKFLEQFPLYCAKQKTLICSKHSKPYLLIVVKGELIIRYGLGIKKQSKILQANSVYNSQGFIFDHNQFSNIYCNSSEAVFLMIDKEQINTNFKLITQASILKFCLQYQMKTNQYEFLHIKLSSANKDENQSQQLWSPFKKPFVIEQIPIKKEKNRSNNTNANTNSKKKDSINVLQTLYQIHANASQSKNKFKTKETQLTEYNNEKNVNQRLNQRQQTIKTQYSQSGSQPHGGSVNQRIKKFQNQLFSLKQQNKSLLQTIKGLKLDLLQAQCKYNMTQVFKEIKNQSVLKQTKNEKSSQATNKLIENKSLSLKEAFDIHLKNKKLQLLVAKCAFKWLEATRRNRSKRQQNQLSHSSLMNKSVPIDR